MDCYDTALSRDGLHKFRYWGILCNRSSLNQREDASSDGSTKEFGKVEYKYSDFFFK